MRATSELLVVLALAGCSYAGAGGSGDGRSGGGGGASATADSGGSAPVGDGGGEPIGTEVEEATWARLRGRFATVAVGGSTPPKHMVGCAVDVPGLAGRAIYVERVDVGSGRSDRQFILVAEQTSPTSILANGVAHLHQPADAAAWRGFCDGPSSLAPGPLEPACDLRAQLALDALNPLMFGGSAVPSSCLGADGSAPVDVSLTVFSGEVEWHDTAPDEAGVELWYELRRVDDDAP